jgi:NAD(P) transhydrogenase subunit beta
LNQLILDLSAVLLLALGLRGLAKLRTARMANGLAALAIGLAVVGLLVSQGLAGWPWMLAGLGVGGGIGVLLALRVPMTAMPETVALFNGCGGMASLLVALGAVGLPAPMGLLAVVSVLASVLVGAITFSGSLVAMAKLQEWLDTPAWTQRQARHAVNITLAVACLACCVVVVQGQLWGLAPLTLLALLLGIGLTLPIGGADMPVVISLLNSYSGVAAAAAGFVVGSSLLIVAGAMVGAAGLILTQVMCTAMNRSLTSVLFGGALGASAAAGSGDKKEAESVRPHHQLQRRGMRHGPGAGGTGGVRARLWPGRGPGPAQPAGTGPPAGRPRGGGGLRHPPGGRSHARPHERAAGRSGCAL